MQDMQWEQKNLLEGFHCSMLFKRQSNPQGQERWSGMLMCLQFSLFLCEEMFCGWTKAQMCMSIQINSKPIKHPRRGYHARLELGVVIYLFRFIIAIMNVFGDGEDHASATWLIFLLRRSRWNQRMNFRCLVRCVRPLWLRSLFLADGPFALLTVRLRSRLKERAQRLRTGKKSRIMKCCAPRIGHHAKLALKIWMHPVTAQDKKIQFSLT